MKYILFAFAFLLSNHAAAACRWVWIDHDYNAGTPAIQKQVCDSTFDIPAIRPPSITPIQVPQIRPIETPSVPPIGTQFCQNQSVYNENTRRWETKRICR